MAKSDKMRLQQAWPAFIRWGGGFLILSFGAIVLGCVAQQADVVRIKRELDAKINQLDKSKTSLQQAVTDANVALDKANTLIAQQRREIQELLQARAEVMDQVATLKETDLSEARGAIEQNQHLVGELDQKFALLDTKLQSVEVQIAESNQSITPLVQDLRAQLTAEEQLRAEQGGKLGEFRTSLVDYQQVLTTLRQNVTQQEQQIVAVQQQLQQQTQQQGMQHRQIQAEFKDVQQQIQSVIGTFEQISTTFGSRLDDYEQKQSETAHLTETVNEASPTPVPLPASYSQLTRKSTSPQFQERSLSSLDRRQEPSTPTNRISHDVVSGSMATSVPQAQKSWTEQLPRSKRKTTQVERIAYQKALNMLRAKHYAGAAKEFSAFLRYYPGSPLAANSQYWLGECYYGQRRFQEAIDEFERVFAFYSSSNKVPASLLKIGYSHLELQQPSIARSVFQQLVRTYPQSQAAIKAHGRLQEVNALLHNPS